MLVLFQRMQALLGVLTSCTANLFWVGHALEAINNRLKIVRDVSVTIDALVMVYSFSFSGTHTEQIRGHS